MSTCYCLGHLYFILEAYIASLETFKKHPMFPLKGSFNTKSRRAEECRYTAFCAFELPTKWHFWLRPSEWRHGAYFGRAWTEG